MGMFKFSESRLSTSSETLAHKATAKPSDRTSGTNDNYWGHHRPYSSFFIDLELDVCGARFRLDLIKIRRSSVMMPNDD